MTRSVDQRVAVGVVYVGALFMSIMDTTIVNVALPAVSRDLGAPAAQIGAVSIAYVVALAVVIPLSAWLGNRFGHRRILLLAIVVFTVSSALCGLAQSLPQLIAARIAQGIGSGFMTPVGMALLYRTFPPSDRVRVASILSIPTIIAPITGPVIGGVLVTGLSWRWVFFVNLPVGVAALVFGLLFLRREDPEGTGPFDAVGFGLAACGVAGVVFGLSEGPQQGWSSTPVLVGLVGGAVLLTLLTLWLVRAAHPLLDVRVFRDRLYRRASGVSILSTCALFGFLFVLALFLQNGLGLSALASGLSTAPEAVGALVGAQLVSRVLYRRVGPRPLMIAGLWGESVAMVLFLTVDGNTDPWTARILVFVVGYFMAHVMVAGQVATMARIDRPSIGAATSILNTLRQVMGGVGVAIMATVLAAVGEPPARSGGAAVDLSAYHAAFATAAGLAFLGGLLALRIRNADADVTRPARTVAR